MPFVGGPHTRITNPRWRTCRHLGKIEKLLYLSRGSSDFDEIWQDDAVGLSWPPWPLKIWNFQNPRWRRTDRRMPDFLLDVACTATPYWYDIVMENTAPAPWKTKVWSDKRLWPVSCKLLIRPATITDAVPATHQSPERHQYTCSTRTSLTHQPPERHHSSIHQSPERHQHTSHQNVTTHQYTSHQNVTNTPVTRTSPIHLLYQNVTNTPVTRTSPTHQSPERNHSPTYLLYQNVTNTPAVPERHQHTSHQYVTNTPERHYNTPVYTGRLCQVLAYGWRITFKEGMVRVTWPIFKFRGPIDISGMASSNLAHKS